MIEDYKRLRQAEAFTQIIELSRSLNESGLSAKELYQASRGELEGEE